MDPQTGKPTDGFYLYNGDKMGPGQQIMFDQIKFRVDQPETAIEALMNYPPFSNLGN
jgi:hypothetical protein